MDSFVLAETFKYLYLLYDSTPHRFIDIDQFLFTTEAHLLPLNLLLFNINETLKNEFNQLTLKSIYQYERKNHSITDKFEERKTKINQCPAMDEQFKSHQYKEKLRENIRGNSEMTQTIITASKYSEKKEQKSVESSIWIDNLLFSISHHRLTAREFSSDNLDHVFQLKEMGIRLQPLPDGRMCSIVTLPSAEYLSEFRIAINSHGFKC